VYENATAMWTWLEEANWTKLFGPTFENVGQWQLVESSRDWIATWACRHVSEETEQSSILMYGSPPRI